MNAQVRKRPGGYATIEVATMAGPRQVDAQIIGALAVHRKIYNEHRWLVTHVRTGCAVGTFARRIDAQSCARRLRVKAEDGDVDLNTPDPWEAADALRSIGAVRVAKDFGGWSSGTKVDEKNYAPCEEPTP